MNTTAILLAAGEGTRMKSSLHKVLHPICGKAMIDYPLDLVRELGVERPVVVVGHGAEGVREHIGDGVDFAVMARGIRAADDAGVQSCPGLDFCGACPG